MKTSLKAALVLGAAPLVIGLAIFALWVLTRAEWLMGAGVVTIYGGIAVIVGAAVCLVTYVWRSWRSRSVARGRLVWQTIGVLALFLANFVAAGGAVFGDQVRISAMPSGERAAAMASESWNPGTTGFDDGGGGRLQLPAVNFPLDIAPFALQTQCTQCTDFLERGER